MARWRTVAGIGTVAVLAVAAAFLLTKTLRGEPEQTAPAPTVAAPSATPTPTSHPDPMPELHNTGDDFDQIIRSIEEFRSWLYRNPNPSLVGEIYHPDCPCFEGVKERLVLLLDDGVRFLESKSLIHEVTLLDRDPDVVALKVVDEGLPSVVIDVETGEVVDEDDGSERRGYRFLLVKSEGRWVVKDIKTASLDLQPPTEDEA